MRADRVRDVLRGLVGACALVLPLITAGVLVLDGPLAALAVAVTYAAVNAALVVLVVRADRSERTRPVDVPCDADCGDVATVRVVSAGALTYAVRPLCDSCAEVYHLENGGSP